MSLTVTVVHEVDHLDVTEGQTLEVHISQLVSLTVTVVHEVDHRDVTKGQTLEKDISQLVSLTVTVVHEVDDLDVTEGQTLEVDTAYFLLSASVSGSDRLGGAILGKRLQYLIASNTEGNI